MSRRDFIARTSTAAAATLATAPLANGILEAEAAPRVAPGRIVLQPFDYQGVTLGPGRWQQQFASARDFYHGVSDDDILCGFRRAANLPAPGQPLGGWCARDSSTVFGQWLQAMARTAHADADPELAAKAVKLIDEWGKTLGANNDPRMRHYPWEKLLGGLNDAQQYLGYDTSALMERITDWGIANLDRTRTPAANTPWELHSGTPLEWYTLGENLYRAAALTGNAKYREFGDVWRYDAYWNRFADTRDPQGAQGVHAYSHCNSFSSAAMLYQLDGDPRLLDILKNFYWFLQDTQCYATGGYGPAERFVYHDGALGESLESRVDSFEAPCCSWAAFKLARYLMTFTGDARYGDWLERLLYNAIGAALPIVENGKHFYYADYHLGAGLKYYSRSNYTCCSGTYFQDVAEYRNLIYFKDANSIYVNLYLPSNVEWQRTAKDTVKLTQDTQYPDAERISIKVETTSPAKFPIRFRVPAWSRQMAFSVNGTELGLAPQPGWTTIERKWQTGDVIDLTIPLRFRLQPIDNWHPERAAVVRGPVVYAQQIPHKNVVTLPPDADALNDWFIATDDPTVFRFKGQVVASQRDDFMPFYRFAELERYRLYHDPTLRTDLW